MRLAAGPQHSIPFAARAGGLAYIVVPIDLLADPARLRLVIAHEAQHHRRGDLLAARGYAWLRVLFFWAPLVGRWERAVAELQDLACDRAVLRRRWVSARDYGRCLLWAAEAARAGVAPVDHAGLARGMASGAAGTLKRRILMMQQSARGSRRMNLVAAALGLVAVAAVAGSAWAVQAAVAERRVTSEQIAAVASRIQQRSGFPVLADERIVQAFNKPPGQPRLARIRAQGAGADAQLPQHDRGHAEAAQPAGAADGDGAVRVGVRQRGAAQPAARGAGRRRLADHSRDPRGSWA